MRLPEPLPQDFFARPAVAVARDLLGRLLVSTVDDAPCIGRIVEVEAYTGPRDPASHAARWHRSPRNAAMYGPPGHAYVYFTYGMHWCCNVVTAREGYPAAVLLRALEPVHGLDAMRARRGGVADRLLTSGPARLAAALGITRVLDAHRLDRAPLWIAAGTRVPGRRRRATRRIGITQAKGRLLRFVEHDNPFLSRR